MTSGRFSRRLAPLHFLAAIFFCLASLSPGTLSGQGYNSENLAACASFTRTLFGDSSVVPAADMPRHGVVELGFLEPVFILTRLLFADWENIAGRILAFQPIFATSLLCTLLFFWIWRETRSIVWAYTLGVIACFGTMLWPYAYTGLETTQSLFILLAGYMALVSDRPRTIARSLLFAVVCAVGISVKSNGIFLIPAVAWLIYRFLLDSATETPRRIRLKALLITLIVMVVYLGNGRARALNPMFAKFGSSGIPSFKSSMLVSNPLFAMMNLFSYFGSVNKSILIFAPVVGLALFAMPSVWRTHRSTAVFSLLVLLGLLLGCSYTLGWGDETWGPRYLHAAIAPLVICLGLSRPIPFRFQRELPLLVLAGFGFIVSLLGILFYYGHLMAAATATQTATLEGFQHDPALNHIRFNGNLARAWMARRRDPNGPDALWEPKHKWWFAVPPDAPKVVPFNIQAVAEPQPVLLRRGWSPGDPIWLCYLVFMILGSLGILTFLRVYRSADVAPDYPLIE